MPEIIADKNVFSLSEVTTSIERTLAKRYSSSFWVKAEMNKLNFYKHSGHCYPDLLEKKDGRIVSQMRATLWNTDYQRINQQFLQILKEPLKDGINILFEASISFSATHGLSLHIHQMEPTYTLGALELEKTETIQRLQAEGIWDANKKLTLPLLPQRIAIISVETSKGYADFLRVIENNQWGYHFFHMLFPALLQGDNAVLSIITQLNQIKKVQHHFDAVAIIRGGGGEVGLTCYNHYALAQAIALFPLPVLTGIGHATNETVAEMVSHSNAITPTKLAEMLIQHFHNFSVPVKNARDRILQFAKIQLKDSSESLSRLTKDLTVSSQQNIRQQQYAISILSRQFSGNVRASIQAEENILSKSKQLLRTSNIKVIQEEQHIKVLAEKLKNNSHNLLRHSKTSVEHLERTIRLLDPMQVVKRGYTLTLKDGQIVQQAGQLKMNDEIITIFADGELSSRVTDFKKSVNE